MLRRTCRLWCAAATTGTGTTAAAAAAAGESAEKVVAAAATAETTEDASKKPKDAKKGDGAAASPSSASASSGGGSEGKAGDNATPPPPPKKEVTPWRKVPVYSWMLPNSSKSNGQLPLFFHGAKLGPRPFLVLDGVGMPPTPATVAEFASKFKNDSVESANATAADGIDGSLLAPFRRLEEVLSNCTWEHGAVGVSLDGIPAMNAPKAKDQLAWIDAACYRVASCMDVLDIEWTHFVTRSVGALVAARMTYLFPDRIGSWVVLDTAVATQKWLDNSSSRKEIADAKKDVNVPSGLLEVFQESLKEELEPECFLEPPTAAKKGKKSDQEKGSSQYDLDAYKTFFFPEGKVLSEDGIVRDDVTRYLSAEHLRAIRHPVQIITPSGTSALDAAVHKDVFNLRKLQSMKAAKEHGDMFRGPGAVELAQLLDNWAARYEPDVVIGRKFKQSAATVLAAAEKAGGGGVSVSSDADSGGSKKKAKSKKGKK